MSVGVYLFGLILSVLGVVLMQRNSQDLTAELAGQQTMSPRWPWVGLQFVVIGAVLQLGAGLYLVWWWIAGG